MSINENEIIRQFHLYLQELNVQDATERMFADCIKEDLSEDEIESVLQDIIIPEIVVQFATKFDGLDNCYEYDPSDDNLNDIFETFCKFEGLSERLANAVATTINTAAAQDEDDEDDDDNEPVFKSKDWARLSDDKRKAKAGYLSREISLLHFRKNDFRYKKIALDERTKRAPNSIFVARQNGCVWKWNAEWVTKQNSDREPVGQPSNNPSLRPRAH